jgi:hypothetical protein
MTYSNDGPVTADATGKTLSLSNLPWSGPSTFASVGLELYPSVGNLRLRERPVRLRDQLAVGPNLSAVTVCVIGAIGPLRRVIVYPANASRGSMVGLASHCPP